MLAILCLYEWHESFDIMVSLCGGFLYIPNSSFVLFRCIFIFKKLMKMCCPFSIVNFTGCLRTQEITRHFKETNIKIAFRTKNTTQNLVKPRLQINDYQKSGVYQTRYIDCPEFMVGFQNIICIKRNKVRMLNMN
jgi:hypothetical protein